jgi:hypothetical protein
MSAHSVRWSEINSSVGEVLSRCDFLKVGATLNIAILV